MRDPGVRAVRAARWRKERGASERSYARIWVTGADQAA